MVKVLKSFIVAILLHLLIQIDILIQIKDYDSKPISSSLVVFGLPIIFGIVAYCLLKNATRKQLWISMASFTAIFGTFMVLGEITDYFKWLFNLVNLSVPYDSFFDYYELGMNAIADGILHTISLLIVFVICFIRQRKVKEND